MKSSRIFKGGTILLVMALAVGIFAAFIIDDLRGNYRFLPYQIMEIAERIKTASVE